MSIYKTIRRDKLKRDIEKGLYVAKCDGRYTDDYAWDAANNYGKTDFAPAILVESIEYRSEVTQFPLYYFREGTHVSKNMETLEVTLYVHSNLSYSLVLKSEWEQYEALRSEREAKAKRMKDQFERAQALIRGESA